MASVTIRNLDDAVVQALKDRAANNSRSLEAELRVILADAAVGRDPAAIKALALEIAAMTPRGVEQTDSTTLIREDRDR